LRPGLRHSQYTEEEDEAILAWQQVEIEEEEEEEVEVEEVEEEEKEEEEEEGRSEI